MRIMKQVLVSSEAPRHRGSKQHFPKEGGSKPICGQELIKSPEWVPLPVEQIDRLNLCSNCLVELYIERFGRDQCPFCEKRVDLLAAHIRKCEAAPREPAV